MEKSNTPIYNIMYRWMDGWTLSPTKIHKLSKNYLWSEWALLNGSFDLKRIVRHCQSRRSTFCIIYRFIYSRALAFSHSARIWFAQLRARNVYTNIRCAFNVYTVLLTTSTSFFTLSIIIYGWQIKFEYLIRICNSWIGAVSLVVSQYRNVLFTFKDSMRIYIENLKWGLKLALLRIAIQSAGWAENNV